MPPKKSTTAAAASETAASSRPRRATAAPASAPAPALATKKRAAPKPADKETAKKSKKAAPKATTTDDVPKAEPTTGAVVEESKAAPRKRGRHPKGGETTKAAVHEEAAEAQLEDELLDSAAGAEVAAAEEKCELPSALLTSTSGSNYWLLKAEQEDRNETAHNGTVINTRFTIDDLRDNNLATGKPELWDGVRNHVAANNMRAMRKGELAFFYASGGKQGRSPGIVGVVEIVSEAEWDLTTRDPGAYGYVSKEKAGTREKWVVVGVEFRRKFDVPVSLRTLQEHKEGRLSGMQLFRQTRLSVAKVTANEWRFIMEELVG
ncbi:hypothetical protein LTR62_006149 [Meristemomyces frigidus]|uniref:EVE domain-containing protein n=1 Tax=Meristemomyces frigidus TaxID=1508187 RepID=A0AAN7TDX9_9PEZI|nr:hypothetical protein LTR62_006149 [Meristemomyces frigidus]